MTGICYAVDRRHYMRLLCDLLLMNDRIAAVALIRKKLHP